MTETEALLTELDRLHAASTQGDHRERGLLAFNVAAHNAYPDLARLLREVTAQRDAETRRLEELRSAVRLFLSGAAPCDRGKMWPQKDVDELHAACAAEGER